MRNVFTSFFFATAVVTVVASTMAMAQVQVDAASDAGTSVEAVDEGVSSTQVLSSDDADRLDSHRGTPRESKWGPARSPAPFAKHVSAAEDDSSTQTMGASDRLRGQAHEASNGERKADAVGSTANGRAAKKLPGVEAASADEHMSAIANRQGESLSPFRHSQENGPFAGSTRISASQEKKRTVAASKKKRLRSTGDSHIAGRQTDGNGVFAKPNKHDSPPATFDRHSASSARNDNSSSQRQP